MPVKKRQQEDSDPDGLSALSKLLLMSEEEADTDPTYYERKGRNYGQYVREAYREMTGNDWVPDEVVVHVLVAFTHSKRERGLW